MTDSEFTKLLTQAAKAAFKHKMLTDKVNIECIERYGDTYSNVDADGIIDVLDVLGADSFTAKEFEAEMEMMMTISQNQTSNET